MPAEGTVQDSDSVSAIRSSGATPQRSNHPVGIPSGYQPALDGIRAVAVVLVMLFHLCLTGGLTIVEGGWLGVDVFFVLSGYLITSLLLGERRRTGRIGLGQFYIRRALRLAPLSIALVIVCVVVGRTSLIDQFQLQLPLSGALSILLYYSNWWNIAHPAGLGSLGHAWSLSVEEQFYFLWPWIVVGVIGLARRSARWILAAITLVGLVAMGLARRWVWLADSAGTPTGDDIINAWLEFFRSSLLRPDGLLFGCLLAILLHDRSVTHGLRRLIGVLGVAGLVASGLIVGHAHFNTWQPWVPFIPVWGLSAFNVAVTLVVAWLVVSPRSLVGRVLSWRAVTWIGRRAYGIYLLNPLVLQVVLAHFAIRRFPLEIIVIGITLVVAGASYRWFESPFLRLKERFSPRRRDVVRTAPDPTAG